MTQDIAKKLRWTAAALAGLMLLVFIANYPPTEESYRAQKPSGYLIGLDGSDAHWRAIYHDDYPQCLMSDSFRGHSCPIGGNFYWLLWLSVAGVTASFIFVKRAE